MYFEKLDEVWGIKWITEQKLKVELKACYHASFAWQAVGTILRILPKTQNDQIVIAANKKLIFHVLGIPPLTALPCLTKIKAIKH